LQMYPSLSPLANRSGHVELSNVLSTTLSHACCCCCCCPDPQGGACVYKWRLSFRSTPAAAAGLHATLSRGICRHLKDMCLDLLQGQPAGKGAAVTATISPLKLGSSSSSSSSSRSGVAVLRPPPPAKAAPPVASMGAKPAAKPAGPPPLPLHEVPEVAIKIVRRSGPACRGSDTGDTVWPGVTSDTMSLQLLTQAVEVRVACLFTGSAQFHFNPYWSTECHLSFAVCGF